MSQSALSVNSNVTIRCIDKYGKVIRTSHIHNKATLTMVEGLLRFLCGDFNCSRYNSNYDYITNDEANHYIPSEVRFGDVGVQMKSRDTDKPLLLAYDSAGHFIDVGQIKKPTFDEFRLQDEIDYLNPAFGCAPVKFENLEMTEFDDPNNSMGLLMRAFFPAGRLVGFKDENSETGRTYFIDKTWSDTDSIGRGKGWVYWNESRDEYEAIFTELGLYSSTGKLLARVVFDGESYVDPEGVITFEDDAYDYNPIIQSDSSSIVVEWRIGIVSIGQNDHVVSGADVGNLGQKVEDLATAELTSIEIEIAKIEAGEVEITEALKSDLLGRLVQIESQFNTAKESYNDKISRINDKVEKVKNHITWINSQEV